MAMGLRFAGSANNQAFETLLYYCKLFTSISSKSIAELAGKSTIETCICVTLLSLAMVGYSSNYMNLVDVLAFLICYVVLVPGNGWYR